MATSPLAFVGGTTTGIAPVAAPPTTAAQLVVWNGDAAKSYTITSVSCSTTTSAAATENLQLFVHSSVAPIPRVPAGGTAAQGPKSMGGGPASPSLAVVQSAVTIVNDGIWLPVGPSTNTGSATATIALGTWALVSGVYVIPPGGMLSLAVVTSSAAGVAKIYVTWTEA